VILSVMGTVGRSMCVPSSLEGANVNRALAVLKIDQGKVLPEFIDYWFRSPHIQSYFETQKFGTAQPRLNLGFLNKMKVPIPKLEEQEQIVDILGEVDDKYWKEKQIHSSLKRLKKGLMQDLLTGEVRTADKPIEVLDEVKIHG
jgi:type I restriction enzyme S subunit